MANRARVHLDHDDRRAVHQHEHVSRSFVDEHDIDINDLDHIIDKLDQQHGTAAFVDNVAARLARMRARERRVL